jgi:hypothetical protein
MAANAFEKTMRNRTLSETGRGAAPVANTRENWSFRVDIHPTDKTLIRSFFGQEIAYYNALVEGLNARLHAFPEALLSLIGPWEELFVDLAEAGINIRRLPAKADDLPANLATHRHTLYDERGNWRALPERTMMILELASASGRFHPLARRAMAQEMIQFYRQQAQVRTASVPVHLREEQVYKTAPEVLETIDGGNKRHVQLPREAVAVKYDAKAHQTTFRVPYARHGITVSGDLTPPQGWNIMVIREAMRDRASDRSVWQMELRKSPNAYYIKMLDAARRGSIFNVAKTARSAV